MTTVDPSESSTDRLVLLHRPLQTFNSSLDLRTAHFFRVPLVAKECSAGSSERRSARNELNSA